MPLALRLTNAAAARLASLPDGGMEDTDFSSPETGFSALLAWVWAMLTPEQYANYPAPETLALAVGNHKAHYIGAVTEALTGALHSDDTAAWFLAELGVSQEQYNRMTPGQTAAVVNAWKARQKREDERTARVCWSIWQTSDVIKSGGGNWEVADFMPQPPLTEEQQAAFMAAKFEVMAASIRAREKLERAASER